MPEFRSPVAGGRTLTGEGVVLTDETGTSLGRRFDGTTRPGTAKRSGEVLEWSVSPGEWTVAGDEPGDVDLTHVRAVFRLSGPSARPVLECVCALDLSDDMFPSGAASRTSVAGVATEIVRDDRNGEPSYLLLPSRSFGGYLWGVIADAGAGLGLA